MSEPTLLEDLATAADVCAEWAAVMSGQKKSYMDPVIDTPLSTRLRAASARLRGRMEHYGRLPSDFEVDTIRELLERINGGPVKS